MRLSELLEELSVVQEELEGSENEDPEILVAFQPNYPLEAGVACVSLVGGTVYVATNQGSGYAPGEAWK